MGSKNQEHVLDLEIDEHEKTDGDNGACLTRHVTSYEEKNSCSHRWQAYRHAEDYPHWYNYPAYKSLCDVADPRSLKTYTAKTNKKLNRLKYLPTAGGWDLTAETDAWDNDKQTIRKFPNFRERATIPYYHNAHHIIPRAVLNNCLYSAANTDVRLFWLVRQGLLMAKYNLNDKENMVILPMSKIVANALSLPRHITQIESEPGVKPEYMKHDIYSDNVRDKVEPVITDFAEQIALEEHDEKIPKLAKQKLLRISQELFMKLRAWGMEAKGKAVDSMPADYFTNTSGESA